MSSLDHSFSSVKDDLSLCDDPLLPSRKIIGDRGGPASMKENVCQVSPSFHTGSLSPVHRTVKLETEGVGVAGV